MHDSAGTGADIAQGVKRAGVPAWVELEDYARPSAPNPHFVANGSCCLLDDVQVDLCGERSWFHRRAELVTAAGGAERVAQFSITIDPSFERIEIHGIRVLRGDQVIDHTGSPHFQVLRREQNLERFVFDGRHTIHLTIPDVRVGDVVETMSTFYGMRKSLGGRHFAWITFDWPVGVIDIRFRQRSRADQALSERRINSPPEAVVTERDGVVDRRWRAVERPPFKFEALTPPWLHQGSSIQFSEWKNWSEVVQAFAPLYEGDDALPEELDAEVRRIEAQERTPAGRAAAILRFTQSAVRYLAISIGEGGYTPRPLSDIWATRYGDCKDKSKLFVAMARRLGIDACPALVNTRESYGLAEFLPSGQVFDHCIVRVRIGAKTHWLDPARLPQAAPLGVLQEVYLGWALPLAEGVQALEAMPQPTHMETLHIHERILLGATTTEPIRYEWRTTHRGWRAEELRSRIAFEGAIGVFKRFHDSVTRVFPSASVVRQEVVEDDVSNNTITTLEQYEIPDGWISQDNGGVAFATLDFFLRGALAELDASPRKHPVYLGHVGRIIRQVDFNTKRKWPVSGFSQLLTAPDLTFESSLTKISNHKFELHQRLDFRNHSLPAEDAPRYREIVGALGKTDIVVSSAVSGTKLVPRDHGGGGFDFRLIWFGLIVLAFLARCASQTGTSPY